MCAAATNYVAVKLGFDGIEDLPITRPSWRLGSWIGEDAIDEEAVTGDVTEIRP